MWLGLGSYSTRIDPIVSGMRLGCLPDPKNPQKSKNIGIRGIGKIHLYSPYSPFVGPYSGVQRGAIGRKEHPLLAAWWRSGAGYTRSHPWRDFLLFVIVALGLLPVCIRPLYMHSTTEQASDHYTGIQKLHGNPATIQKPSH